MFISPKLSHVPVMWHNVSNTVEGMWIYETFTVSDCSCALVWPETNHGSCFLASHNLWSVLESRKKRETSGLNAESIQNGFSREPLSRTHSSGDLIFLPHILIFPVIRFELNQSAVLTAAYLTGAPPADPLRGRNQRPKKRYRRHSRKLNSLGLNKWGRQFREAGSSISWWRWSSTGSRSRGCSAALGRCTWRAGQWRPHAVGTAAGRMEHPHTAGRLHTEARLHRPAKRSQKVQSHFDRYEATWYTI